MAGEEIRLLVEQLRGIVSILQHADPDDRRAVYQELNVSIDYHTDGRLHVKAGTRWSDENAMLLGVYSSIEKAQRRIERARLLPGFRRFPNDFIVDEYEVDHDEWTSSFATPTEDGWVDDPNPA